VCTTPNDPSPAETSSTGTAPTGTGGVHNRGPGGSTRWIAQMAVDAEYQFFQSFGTVAATLARVNLVINVMNLQYEREVQITHQITTIIVRQAQNYAPNDPTRNLRQQFQDNWNINHTGVPRDLAIMFDANGLGGQAVPGGRVCDVVNAYAGTGHQGLPLLSYSCDVVAHESGHLWSACHCLCDSPPYTMHWYVTGANRFLGAPVTTPESDAGCPPFYTSVSRIVEHRTAATCLHTDNLGSPIRNDACAGAITIEPGMFFSSNTSSTFGFDNFGATTDGPNPSCQSLTGDIWYRFTARCTSPTFIDTCGSDFNTGIVVYTGSCGALTQVACGDDTFSCDNVTNSRVEVAAIAGQTYLVRIGGHNGGQGSGILRIDELYTCAPRNNSCTTGTQIYNGFPLDFSSLGATTDGPTEGLACNNAGDQQLSNDIWYYYITPCAGTHRVSVCGATFDTKLAAYAFCPSNSFQALACNDDNGPACSGLQSSLDVQQNAGLLLVFRIGGYQGQTGTGIIRVDSLSCPRPPNDRCASAIPAVLGGTYIQPLFAATNDGTADCGNSAINRDIWYSFISPCNGTLRAHSCGTHDIAGTDTGIDTVVSIHTACPGDGDTQIAGACNDDFINATDCLGYDTGILRDSMTSASLTAGQRVLIRLSHYGTATPPNTLTRFFVTFMPPNDRCVNAVSVGEGSTQYCTFGAAVIDPGTCASRSDIWYRYTASCTGVARISLCGSTFDTQLAFYGNDLCSNLASPLFCNLDNGPACAGLQSSLDAPVTAGASYLVRIGGFFGVQGSGSLNISCSSAPGACCDGATCSLAAAQSCAGPGQFFAGGNVACNLPGNNSTPCSFGDFNQSGGTGVQDIFDFLAAYFSADPRADINGSGSLTVQDIFDFLSAYFGS